jgi:hypothetical protein
MATGRKSTPVEVPGAPSSPGWKSHGGAAANVSTIADGVRAADEGCSASLTRAHDDLVHQVDCGIRADRSHLHRDALLLE